MMKKRLVFVSCLFLFLLCTPDASRARYSIYDEDYQILNTYDDIQFEYPSEIEVLFLRLSQVHGNEGAPVRSIDGTYIPLDTNGAPNPQMLSVDDDYLPNVVETEITNVIGTPGFIDTINYHEAIKAQAIAARSFAFHKYYQRHYDNYPNDCMFTLTDGRTVICDVTNSTNHQVYSYGEIPSPRSQTQVDLTKHLYLSFTAQKEGQEVTIPAFTQFSSDHRATGFFTRLGPESYHKSIYDPITSGEEGSGNTAGMSQYGALKWSRGYNSNGILFPKWSVAKILAHYYTGIQLTYQDGSTNHLNQWGQYRWNMIQFGTPNTPYAIPTDTEKSVNMVVQNTGTQPWDRNFGVRVRWHRYYYGSWQAQTAWLTTTLNHDTTLAPGEHMTVAPGVTFPQSFYYGYNHIYSYCAEVDFFLTDDHKRMSEQGWETQVWCHLKIFKPMPAPPSQPVKMPDDDTTPVEPDPTPAPAPPCNSKNCPTPQRTQPIIWNRVAHSDPVDFIWRITDAHQQPVASGITIQPATGYPQLIPPALAKGNNFIYVQARQQDYGDNVSAEIKVATVNYDPDAPIITTTGPDWIKPGQPIDMSMTIDDTALSSGIKVYTRTMTYANHPPSSDVVHGNPSTFHTTTAFSPATSLDAAHRSTYTFALTVSDYALNRTMVDHTVTVDAHAPTLVHSTHPIWTNQATVPVTWEVTDHAESGIAAVVIDYRSVNGTWFALSTTNVQTTGTVTLTGLQDESTYELRYTMTDAVGNQARDIKTIKTDFNAPTAAIPDVSDSNDGSSVVTVAQAWTDIHVTGADLPQRTGAATSGIAWYEVRWGTQAFGADMRPIGLPTWLGSRFISHLGRETLHFKTPEQATLVFQVRARDWAGNLGPWSTSTVPYIFGSGYDGYYGPYAESYIPLFRPQRVAPLSAPPATQATQQRETIDPYPLPGK